MLLKWWSSIILFRPIWRYSKYESRKSYGDFFLIYHIPCEITPQAKLFFSSFFLFFAFFQFCDVAQVVIIHDFFFGHIWRSSKYESRKSEKKLPYFRQLCLFWRSFILKGNF
jgi:hypothetical protein